jgi:hypothetical protein
MTINLLHNVPIPTLDDYLVICRDQLLSDLQNILAEFELFDMTQETEYSDVRKILTREIIDRIDSQITCTNLNMDTVEDSPCSFCPECLKRVEVLKITDRLYDSGGSTRYRDPPHVEFWTSFHPILDRLTQYGLTHSMGDHTFQLFLDDGPLRSRMIFFNALIGCYSDLIDHLKRVIMNTLMTAPRTKARGAVIYEQDSHYPAINY